MITDYLTGVSVLCAHKNKHNLLSNRNFDAVISKRSAIYFYVTDIIETHSFINLILAQWRTEIKYGKWNSRTIPSQMGMRSMVPLWIGISHLDDILLREKKVENEIKTDNFRKASDGNR